MQKYLVILFGKTGAGKNYTAEIFEREFGFYFYDADQDLTAAMKKAIIEGTVFTEDMRDEYLEVIISRTKRLLEFKPKVVLTQGLFKNKQRHELSRAFPDAQWIWIDADEGLLKGRIEKRKSSVTWEYAQMINSLFEIPDFECERIMNNGGREEILQKISRIGRKLFLRNCLTQR